ncbi:MAG: BatA domain-containing protein, partial [Myxococcota bacterium]|nr:BatA domain-containing protein [Myxococcota bacterium]
MAFETPWLLLGLLGAAVPVIIHLINRQRARLRRFAALEYLLLSDKRLAQRLRLRQLLVLLLRMLLLAAIPFALAKPYLESDPSAVGDLSDPGAVVLVVDDSMSMTSQAQGSDTALGRAVELARDSVQSGGARTRFAVVMAGKPARLITPGFTYEHDVLERALDSVTPGPRSGDMAGALREAEALLADTTDASRRVLVIGDQAAHAWSSVTEPWSMVEPPQTQLVDVVTDVSEGNAAVTGVRVRPAPEVGPEQVRVEVDIMNHGSRAMERQLRVSLAGSVVLSQVALAPGSAQTAVSLHRL